MHRLTRFEYHAPVTVEEAVSLLAGHGEAARLVAGGTDMLVAMKHRLCTPEHLINLASVPELDFMGYDETAGLCIGPAVSLARLSESPLIRDKYPALVEAASKVGSVQVRNQGTIGGNLCLDTRCWYYNQSAYWRKSRPPCHKTGGDVCHVVPGSRKCFAVYSGDTAPVLMVLGAEVKLVRKGGERTIPVSELYTGDGLCPNAIAADEIITEVSIPAPADGSGAAYVKLRLRDEVDFPILGVAAAISIEKGVCNRASVVLNAVAPSPFEVPEAGEILAGKRPDGEVVEEVAQTAYKLAHPVPNTAGTPEYRRRMVPTLVKHAIHKAAEDAGS